MKKSICLAFMGLLFCTNIGAQEATALFRTIPLWEGHSDKGALLISPKEMLVVDSKGQKLGKITANEPINGVWISPEGNKVLYTTAAAIWLVNVSGGAAYLVRGGTCEFIKWNIDGLGFMFAIQGTYFWADSDGKNVKQVYP